MKAMQALIARRRDGHWASRLMAANSSENRAGGVLRRDRGWGGILRLEGALRCPGFRPTAEAALMAYRSSCSFDQLYRHFRRAAERSSRWAQAVLHELRVQIETCRVVLPQFGTAWARVVEGQAACWSAGRRPGCQISIASSISGCATAGWLRSGCSW